MPPTVEKLGAGCAPPAGAAAPAAPNDAAIPSRSGGGAPGAGAGASMAAHHSSVSCANSRRQQASSKLDKVCRQDLTCREAGGDRSVRTHGGGVSAKAADLGRLHAGVAAEGVAPSGPHGDSRHPAPWRHPAPYHRQRGGAASRRRACLLRRCIRKAAGGYRPLVCTASAQPMRNLMRASEPNARASNSAQGSP